MITYNHERYVTQAIQSVLRQRCNFEFVLHISDDGSKDATARICKEFAESYPNTIQFVRREKNIGMTANATLTLLECLTYGSPYIALLEGDDYWIDDLKLQKQVEFLETHSEFGMLSTDAHAITNGLLSGFYDNKPKPSVSYGIWDFLKRYRWVPTCTTILRRNILEEVVRICNGQLKERPPINFDFLIWAVAGKFGKYAFIDEKTAVYRRHGSGIMGTLGGSRTWFEKGLDLNHFLSSYFEGEYDDFFLSGDWWYYSQLAYLDISEKAYLSSINHLLLSMYCSKRNPDIKISSILRDYLYRLRTS